MTYNLRTDFLSDEEAERLAERFPHLAVDVGPYDYCPTCDKTGKYRWRGEEHLCDCAYQLQLHKHYLNSGIGVTYQRLDWNDWWDASSTLPSSIREEYLDKPYVKRGMGLFLYGTVGTGKTMLATLALKELVKQGLRCYAVTFDQMIDEFTKGWGSDEDKRWFERKIKYADVLLLDDIGKEHQSRSTLPQSTFNNLLRSRVQGGRPTLITTNLFPSEFDTCYGGSSMRLLYESSLSLAVAGEDYSPKINARNTAEIKLGEMRPIV